MTVARRSVLGMLGALRGVPRRKAAALGTPFFLTADSKGVRKRSLQVQILRNVQADGNRPLKRRRADGHYMRMGKREWSVEKRPSQPQFGTAITRKVRVFCRVKGRMCCWLGNKAKGGIRNPLYGIYFQPSGGPVS